MCTTTSWRKVSIYCISILIGLTGNAPCDGFCQSCTKQEKFQNFSRLNLTAYWRWISAFNILYWKYPQKLGLYLKWTGQGRGTKIRAHSKEQHTAAGHFSLADAFWPKKHDKIWIPSLLGGQLPFFGWSKPVKTNNNITLILSYKLIEKIWSISKSSSLLWFP